MQHGCTPCPRSMPGLPPHSRRPLCRPIPRVCMHQLLPRARQTTFGHKERLTMSTQKNTWFGPMTKACHRAACRKQDRPRHNQTQHTITHLAIHSLSVECEPHEQTRNQVPQSQNTRAYCAMKQTKPHHANGTCERHMRTTPQDALTCVCSTNKHLNVRCVHTSRTQDAMMAVVGRVGVEQTTPSQYANDAVAGTSRT